MIIFYRILQNLCLNLFWAFSKFSKKLDDWGWELKWKDLEKQIEKDREKEDRQKEREGER